MQRSIHQIYSFKASIADVWRALTDPKWIDEWGGGPAKMDGSVGTKFTLWGGDIHGTNIEVLPKRKLVQEWYGGKWPAPSIVTFELSSHGETTTITLTHLDLPEKAFKEIEEGWREYYLGPLQGFLEQRREESLYAS